MKDYYVYVVRSERAGRFYVGSCRDIEIRLAEHNRGRTRSTKYGRPWVVVYSEHFPTKQEAFQRERQIKSYKGGRAFKALF